MAEIYLHGDNMERIGLSVEEGKLVMTLELPETSLKKTTKRDEVQFYQTRPLRIDPESQIFLMKFLEYANLAFQAAYHTREIQKERQISGPQIQKQTLGFDMGQLLQGIITGFDQIINQIPKEQMKKMFKKCREIAKELEEEETKE